MCRVQLLVEATGWIAAKLLRWDPQCCHLPPAPQVFMLPVERPVDEECLQDILSRGHSRVPVYTAGDRCALLPGAACWPA